jgi:hypothetical protein
VGEPPASFKGGIHVRQQIGGVGAPIGGHLEVTNDAIRFSGLGLNVTIPRRDVQAVRFGPGIGATRISAVLLKPAKEQMIWFSTRHPEPVRAALSRFGWEVVDDPNFDLGVAEEYPGSPG